MATSALSVAKGAVRARRLREPPVIVGGCERSGTTLLTSILSAHPHVQAVPVETWAFCYGAAAGFDGDRPIRPHRLYRCLGADRLKPTARRWCEKSPANVFYFDRIREHFGGQVRFVQIVRDGRDVVTSEHPDRPGEPWVRVRRWKKAALAGLRHREAPDVLTLRYRDLVLDYCIQIARICAFLEEPVTSEMAEWHRYATLRASGNLNGATVPKLHAGSLRKFERSDCPHVERADELASDPEAIELLAAYGFE